MCTVFFFQAEDGIRDVAVTGVQTCALPIFLAYLHYIQVIRVFLQDRVVVVCHANTLRSGHGFSTYYFPRRTLTFGFLSDSPCGTPVLYSSSPSPSLLETLPTALFAPSLFWLSRLQTCAVSCHA